MIRRKLQEVETFHKKVYEERKEFLSDKKGKIEHEMVSLQNQIYELSKNIDRIGAVISVNDGGRSIVHQSNNEVYLIYLIDFYIKLRLQHLDKLIIDDSFMQQNKSRENLESLFILKANYFSEEVADSFQPTIIDKKIKAALGIDSLMKNIEENIVKTNEIIKDNNSAVIAIIAAIYVALNELVPYFTESIIVKIGAIAITSLAAFLLWKKRNIIGQKIEGGAFKVLIKLVINIVHFLI